MLRILTGQAYGHQSHLWGGHDTSASSSVRLCLLIHRRIACTGPPVQRTRNKALDISTAAVQEQFRRLRWEDLIRSLQEEPPGQPVSQALE